MGSNISEVTSFVANTFILIPDQSALPFLSSLRAGCLVMFFLGGTSCNDFL